jgi:hypothetical protein
MAELTPQQREYMRLLGRNIHYDSIRSLSPTIQKQFDQVVVQAAYSQNMTPEQLTNILSQAPYAQKLAQENIGAANAYLTPIDSAYRQRQMAVLRQNIAHETKSVLKTGYQVFQTTEQALFSITPLPLKQIKSGLKTVGFPVMTAVFAAHLPPIGSVVSSGIALGGHLMSTASVAIAGSALAHFGHSFMATLPRGGGLHSLAGSAGAALMPMALGAVRNGGFFLGQMGAAALTGNAILKGSSSLSQSIRKRGLGSVITEGWQRLQGIGLKTRILIESTKLKIEALQSRRQKNIHSPNLNQSIEKENAMTQFNNQPRQLPDNFGIPIATGLTEQQIADMGDISTGLSFHKAETARQQLNEYYRRSAEGQTHLEGLPIIKELQSQYDESRFTLQDRLQELSERGKYQIPEGAALVEKPQSTVIEAQQKGKMTPEITPPSNSPPNIPPDSTIQNFDSEPEPSLNPPSKEENLESASYAFSLQQMLAQRGINADRLQIHFRDGNREEATFSMESGKATPLKNNLTAKHVEMLKAAMSDPDFKGEIKITQGSKTLFHRIGGAEPIVDDRGLYKAAAKFEYTSESEVLYRNSSASVCKQGLARVEAIAMNAFRTGASREEVFDAMQHDKIFQGLDSKQAKQYLDLAQSRAELEKKPSQVESPAKSKTLQVA